MALREVGRGHGTACGGEGTRHCMLWRGDKALHVVGRGRHCMRWRGDMALHVVEIYS